jgi:hypothetical protein
MAFRFRSLLVTSLPLLLLGGMAVFLLKVPDVPPPEKLHLFCDRKNIQ